MCKVHFRIKASCENAPKEYYVPCGRCRDCRNVMRSSWYFRLRAEFEHLASLGWRFAFFTLTYNEGSLPVLPLDCFPDCRDYVPKPCFSRDDIRNFVHSFRQWLYRVYDVKGCRYMICSEYGEHTKRPHYHGVIAVPSNVDMIQLCEWLREAWSDKGFLIPSPKYAVSGGYDVKGRYHQPFEVSGCNASLAAWYASKYCCKDLNFCESVENLRVDRKTKSWKYAQPFHVQSRSLGIGVLSKLLTDSEKFEAFFNGVAFLGEDKLFQLPVYIKNKILFTPKYIVDSRGKRLVRREATEFFKKYYKDIYREKVKFYQSMSSRSVDSVFWQEKGLSEDVAKVVAANCSVLADEFYKFGNNKDFSLADMYVSYYGVPYDKCYYLPVAEMWFERYYPLHKDLSCCLRLDKDFLDSANCYWDYVFGCLHECAQERNEILMANDRELDWFHDYITGD